jgi:hypothetical protein
MKRNNKSQQAKTQPPSSAGLPKIRPMAAGIDVGSQHHYVCAPAPQGGTAMRVFGTTTPELLAIAEWLAEAQAGPSPARMCDFYWPDFR